MDERIIKFSECIKNDFELSEDIISNLRTNTNNALIIEGYDLFLSHIQKMVSDTQSSLILHTPQIIPEFLEFLSMKAYMLKSCRFLWISNIDYEKDYFLLNKIITLGNIQFRNTKEKCNYYYCTRDTKEFLIGKSEEESSENIFIFYEREDILKDIQIEMGAYFLKNSIPFFLKKKNKNANHTPGKVKEKKIKKSRKQRKIS